MTPEREAEIREWTAQKQHCEFYGSHWLMASDLLAEIDRLRAIPDKDLDRLIDEFMLNGYPLNPDDMKAEMHKHFGPMWAKCNSLMATRDGLWEMYERLLPEYARHTEEKSLTHSTPGNPDLCFFCKEPSVVFSSSCGVWTCNAHMEGK